MAESKSFFGLRKGSTKSLTFQVLNGKQITKDRVYNVKNPQTLGQMQQRALMATAVTAYSAMKEICDHSFEGIEAGAKTMGAFIKENLLKLSADMPKINVTEYKSGNYAQNKYIISKGSLVAPNFVYSKENKKLTLDLAGIVPINEATTWGALAEGLGIKKDGMLTFCVMTESRLDWFRIKFNDKMWDKAIEKDSSNIDQLKTYEAIESNNLVFGDIIVFEGDKSGEAIAAINVTIEEAESGAVIISEKDEGKWKRSTAYLEGNINFQYEAGFASYPVNNKLLLNGGKMPTNIIAK